MSTILDDITIEYVDPPLRTEPVTEPVVKTKPDNAPKLNRVERRRLQRYIAHKATLQMRHVYKKHPGLKALHRTERAMRCGQCGLWFLGGSTERCQCKVFSIQTQNTANS